MTNTIVRGVLFVERLGFLVRAPCNKDIVQPLRYVVLAWVALSLAVLLSLVYYVAMNKGASWIEFFVGIVQDAGVSFIGMCILLLSPVSTVLGIGEREGPVKAETMLEEYKKITEERVIEAEKVSEPEESNDVSTQIIPTHDTALYVHLCILAFVTITSQIADYCNYYQHRSLLSPVTPFFILGSLIETVFYAGGFFVLSVMCRVASLRIQYITGLLEQAACDVELGFGHPRDRIELLGTARAYYKTIFSDVERVNCKISAIALIAVLLAAVELASIVQSVFYNGSIEDHAEEGGGTLAAVDMFRLIVCVGMVILQFTYAAAEVAHSSERLAEKCALLAVTTRQRIAEIKMGLIGNYGTMRHSKRQRDVAESIADIYDAKASEELNFASKDVAEVSESLGEWARSHPVRVSVLWFYLTPEWATGMSFVVFALLLIVFGFKLPLSLG